MMMTKLILSVAALALACAPGPSTLQPHPAPGDDASASRLLGAANPGATTPISAADRKWIDRTLSSLTLRQKIGQLMMPWVGGDYAAIGSPEFEQVRKWVQDDEVGGLVLSIGMPLSYAAKLNELQSRARVPLLIASDMENGPGMRLGNIYALPSLLPQGGGTVFPPVMALGATRSEDLAFKLGQVLGSEARAIGVHMVFGPVLDVNSNALNPVINTRSFGENPELVSHLAQAYIRGARSMGLMTTGKHFPGHGDTDVDSHLDLPTIRADRAQLDSLELYPFRQAITANVGGIMIAHLYVPAIDSTPNTPSSISYKTVTGLLKQELGYKGIVITDALEMKGIAKFYTNGEESAQSLLAGNDMMMLPSTSEGSVDAIKRAVRKDLITMDEVN